MNTPENTAVVFEGLQLSYKELNERSNQLAHYLRNKGVKQETLVPLYVHRGLDMIVAILGIMKAGAAYVPIDTDFPEGRIKHILENTGASIIITSRQCPVRYRVRSIRYCRDGQPLGKRSKFFHPRIYQLAYNQTNWLM